MGHPPRPLQSPHEHGHQQQGQQDQQQHQQGKEAVEHLSGGLGVMPHEGGARGGNEGEEGDEGEALHGGVAEGDTLPSPPCHLEPRTRTLCRREDNFASSNCCGSSSTLRLGRRGTVNLDVSASNTSSLRASGITAKMTRRYSRTTQPLCRGTERGTEGATRHSRGNEQEQTEGTTRPGTARAGWLAGSGAGAAGGGYEGGSCRVGIYPQTRGARTHQALFQAPQEHYGACEGGTRGSDAAVMRK